MKLKLPHIIDYYSGDDSIIDMTTRLCVVNEIKYIGTFEKELIIRRIHHFGYIVWLGKPEKIKAYSYQKVDGKYGPISIMASEGRFIVPRQFNSKSNVNIILYNKSIYKINKKSKVKELVIKDNMPFVREYKIGRISSLSDEDKGIKGYLVSKRGREIVVV